MLVRIWLAQLCVGAIVGTALLGAGSVANAQCAGGKLLKGGYGVVIFGATASGGAEALAGTMQADGQCSLTASLSGNVNGTEVNAVTATGTYSIGSNLVGNLTIALPDTAPQSFAFNWVIRHRQVVGAENDGLGTAQIDARLQQLTQFGPGVLAGPYSYQCSAADNQPALLLSVVYDGIGAVQVTGFEYTSGALAPWGPGQGTYQVNPDGSYSLTLQDGLGDEFVFGGAVDSLAFNAPLAAISENGSGVISGATHCVGQKQ